MDVSLPSTGSADQECPLWCLIWARGISERSWNLLVSIFHPTYNHTQSSNLFSSPLTLFAHSTRGLSHLTPSSGALLPFRKPLILVLGRTFAWSSHCSPRPHTRVGSTPHQRLTPWVLVFFGGSFICRCSFAVLLIWQVLFVPGLTLMLGLSCQRSVVLQFYSVVCVRGAR
jgi:hypothetical protein